MSRKPVMMILTDWYYPAYQAGGPVQSCVNMVELLKSQYDIFVLTSNKELDKSSLNLSHSSNTWIDLDGYKIKYTDKPKISNSDLYHIRPDILFFNTIFSVYFNHSLLKILLSKASIKIIISLRGMLKPSAIKIKFLKKNLFIILLKLIGIERKVTFHATNQIEATETLAYFPYAKIVVLNNIPFINPATNKENAKIQGQCKLLFASRLHPIKNLSVLLKCLKNVQHTVELTIRGEWVSEAYKKESEKLIEEIPSNVSVSIKSSLPHEALIAELSQFDIFILPTKGENFGHSIFEALSIGLPVIISDQTPWKKLQEQGIGFDLPLNDTTKFSEKIDFFAKMSHEEYQNWSDNAYRFAKKFIEEQQYLVNYNTLLKKDNEIIGIMGPLPLVRYKGGISVFIEQLLKRQSSFNQEGLQLVHLNTCVVRRKNDSIGKMRVINLYNYCVYMWRSIKTIRRERIQQLHVHTSIGLSLIKDSFSACVFRYLLGQKIILHIHFAEEKQLLPSSFKWFTRRLIKNSAHQFIVLSNSIKKYLTDAGVPAAQIHQINNFHFQVDPIIALDKRENETKIITFIGSLDERKGILDLMTAIAFGR